MREVPALSASTSKTSARSSPAISPSTRASAAARLWIVTRWLAMNFILLPLPKAPTYFCARDMPASTSWQRSKAASSPLAKTTSSFVAACAPVPLTGQSSRILPCAASCASPRAFTSIGRVLHSMTIWPLPLLEAMPPWPAITLLEGIYTGQGGDQDLGLFGGVARRGGGDPASLREPRHRSVGDVIADDLEAVLYEVAHHRRAHDANDANADNADALRHNVLPKLCRRPAN